MLTNAHLTIYNKYTDTTTRAEKYQRTTVKLVNWQGAKAVYQANVGMVKSDTASIYIPFARGANYLDPVAWRALTTKTGKWTIQEGDVIVKGLVTDEIITGFTVTNLRAKYNDVVVVTAIDVNDQGSANMQHWRVGAK